MTYYMHMYMCAACVTTRAARVSPLSGLSSLVSSLSSVRSPDFTTPDDSTRWIRYHSDSPRDLHATHATGLGRHLHYTA